MAAILESLRMSLMAAGIGWAARPHLQRLWQASLAPEAAQREVLLRILQANAPAAFGRDHAFAGIRSVDAFQAAVPVQNFESLRPYIERQELTHEASLTVEPPVYYHRTSGTVAKPKDIPITRSGLARIKRHQQIAAYAQSRGSRAFAGKVFAVTGQAVEGTMPGGSPYGSASGLLYENQPRLVRSRFVLPPSVASIEDYDCRYLVMAAHALAAPAVTCVATANPSTLTRLLAVVNGRSADLIDIVGAQRFPKGIPRDAAFATGADAGPARARQLEAMFKATGGLTLADIWPQLGAVVTWTGGSCGVPLAAMRPAFPAGCKVIELGYVASEVRGTVNIDVDRNTCLPTLLDTFFEFAERDAWEAGGGGFLLLHELEVGREYYVFVTTADGLYRYDMNDIVRVTGILNATPTLAFVQKGKGVTSITGEKLHESQVLDAVDRTLAAYHVASDFFIVLADQDTAGYTLYVEAPSGREAGPGIAEAVDRRLSAANLEYAAKRASGRLSALAVQWLRPGTGEAYRAARVAAGQRDAQFKYLHLQYAHECPFAFATATAGW